MWAFASANQPLISSSTGVPGRWAGRAPGYEGAQAPGRGGLTRPPSRLGAGPGWEQKALPVLRAAFCRCGKHQGRWLALSGPQVPPRAANAGSWWGIVVCVARSGTSPLTLFSLPSLMLGASPGRALGGRGGGAVSLILSPGNSTGCPSSLWPSPCGGAWESGLSCGSLSLSFSICTVEC